MLKAETESNPAPAAHQPEARQDGSAIHAARGREGRHARPAKEYATLSLDERCNIDDCNASGEELFGYARGQLIGRSISVLLPELSESALVRNGEPNPYLKFLSRIGHRFNGVCQDKRHFACELFVNFLHNPGSHFATIIIVPVKAEGGERRSVRRLG